MIVRVLWYCLLIPGVLMLLGALVAGGRTLAFRQTARHTQGVVIANHFSNESGSAGEGTFHPEVEFTTPDGGKHRFVSGTGSSRAAFEVGESAPVLYAEGNPDRASIDTFFHQFGGPLFSVFLGLVFSAMGGIPLYFQRKNSARATASEPQ